MERGKFILLMVFMVIAIGLIFISMYFLQKVEQDISKRYQALNKVRSAKVGAIGSLAIIVSSLLAKLILEETLVPLFAVGLAYFIYEANQLIKNQEELEDIA